MCNSKQPRVAAYAWRSLISVDVHSSRLVTTIQAPDRRDASNPGKAMPSTGHWHNVRLIGRLLDPAARLLPTPAVAQRSQYPLTLRTLQHVDV
jgi:hypothetical protein